MAEVLYSPAATKVCISELAETRVSVCGYIREADTNIAGMSSAWDADVAREMIGRLQKYRNELDIHSANLTSWITVIRDADGNYSRAEEDNTTMMSQALLAFK